MLIDARPWSSNGAWASASLWRVHRGQLSPLARRGRAGTDLAGLLGDRQLEIQIRGLAAVLENRHVRCWLTSDALRARIDVEEIICLDTRRLLEREAWRLIVVLAAPGANNCGAVDPG